MATKKMPAMQKRLQETSRAGCKRAAAERRAKKQEAAKPPEPLAPFLSGDKTGLPMRPPGKAGGS